MYDVFWRRLICSSVFLFVQNSVLKIRPLETACELLLSKACKQFDLTVDRCTVKPLLSGPTIKRTSSIKRTQSGPEISVIMTFTLITNPYSADTLY